MRGESARVRAFEEFVGHTADPVRRFLVRRTDHATAEDVLAETMSVCWRRFDELTTDDMRLPWAYTVARNCLLNARRGATRRERLVAKMAAVDPPRDHVDTLPGDGVDPALHAALASLRPDDVEILRLWAWEELTISETAAVLEVSTNVASVRLHRAKKRLRERLLQDRGEAGHEQGEGGTTP